MSDKPFSEPIVPPLPAPRTGQVQAENWHVNEISSQELGYLANHHQLASDFSLAYQPDSRETEAAIYLQMLELGDKLGGVLSWLSIFDSGKQKA